jgi:arylsulfatase A-like enzyme
MVKRVIMVILDGLRRDFLDSAETPNLVTFGKTATTFEGHRSTFPSTTRVVSSTLATGCNPSRHGLQGNSMVLVEDGRLVLHDVGAPDFLQHKRRVTGCSLAAPTLAERLAPHGGAIVFNNVSPGAAYAHDPDGHGWVYHRAGSYGPGRKPVAENDHLNITLSIDGDRQMAERFLDEVVMQRRPALSLIWFGEPDHIQHEVPMGSPEHRAVIREIDACAGRIIATVEELRRAGEDILLIVGSDHGHQTVTDVIDVDAELVAAGLKSGIGSDDIVVAPNGTAALVYVHPAVRDRLAALEAFLTSRPWAGAVLSGAALATAGQSAANGLAFAITMRADGQDNDFGVPGRSLVVKPIAGKPDRSGCGQHGGTGRYEQSPFLMIAGAGFAAGSARKDDSGAVDIAPTVLRHLGLPEIGMDGRALQGGSGEVRDDA